MRLDSVKVILFDVDGVLTDGGIILGPGGWEAKRFDVKDGHRIKMARRAGIRIYLVTGRSSEAVTRRAAELGLDGVYQGVLDKRTVLEEIARASGSAPAEMAFMGDDLTDLPLMRLVGIGACPADAVPEVRRAADLVVDAPGGRGAAGLFIESVLKARGDWDALTARYHADHG
jgi:YrbI family 3-deoxy-D-manno-octulosonate 8-phosphate phosphatase